MKGQVDRVWKNERQDGSDYWVVSIDGKRYSAFDADTVAGIGKGDSVEFAYTQSGGYRNLTALKRTGPKARGTDQDQVARESLRIVKMSCLRTGAEMVKDTSLRPEQKMELVISMAEKLEAHVLTAPENGKCAQSGEGEKTGTSDGGGDT